MTIPDVVKQPVHDQNNHTNNLHHSQMLDRSNIQAINQSNEQDDYQQQPIAEILHQTGLKLRSPCQIDEQSINSTSVSVLMLIGYNGSKYHGFQYQSIYQPIKQSNKQSKKRSNSQLLSTENNQFADQPSSQLDMQSNNNLNNIPVDSRQLVITDTIEYQLFLSLIKSDCFTGSIDRSSLCWTRAARTDAGVHAVINYISFSLTIDPSHMLSVDTSINQSINELLRQLNQTINHHLPVDIRCHSLSAIEPDFHARFNCSLREYTYMLPTWVLISRDKLIEGITSANYRSINQTIDQSINQSINLSSIDINTNIDTIIKAAEQVWTAMDKSLNDQLSNYPTNLPINQPNNETISQTINQSNNQTNYNSHRRTVKRSTLIKAQKLRQAIDQSNKQKMLDFIQAARSQSIHKFNDKFELDRLAIKQKTQLIDQSNIQSNNQSIEPFRLSHKDLNEMNQTMNRFVGTHDFRRFGSSVDCSTEQLRTIDSFTIDRLIVRSNVEYAVISIKGSSFMLHQIRRMISVSVALIRKWIDQSFVNQLMGSGFPCTLALSPSSTLVLMRARFDKYDQSINQTVHQTIKQIEDFANELESTLLSDAGELRSQFRSWLLSLLASVNSMSSLAE